MKNLLITWVTSALTLCLFVGQSFAFSDVNDTDWHYNYINSVLEQGLLYGYDDGTFRPNEEVTLAEFCVMISNAYYGTSLAMIADAESLTKWWEPYVYSTHLRDGLENTVVGNRVEDYKNDGYRFNLWDSYVSVPLTRYDAAAILTNVLLDRYYPEYSASETSAVVAKISDVDSSNPYATSVAMAYDNSLIYGYENGEFNGDKSLNRAEAAVLLHALWKLEDLKEEKRSDAEAVLASEAYNMSAYDATGWLDIENYVFARVNELRASLGLNTLISNSTLVDYAFIRAKESKEHWAHVRPDGTSWSTVIAEDDVNNHLTGENLTMGTGFAAYEYADMIFKSWLNSPSHYNNMIAPIHKELGVAVYIDEEGGYYATQLFGVSLT